MANNTENLKLIISGDGKLLGAELVKSEAKIDKFTRRTENAFTRMGQKVKSGLGSMFKSFGGPLSVAAIGAGTGAFFFKAGKEVIDFDSKIAQLQNQFSLTAGETLALRSSIIKSATDARQSWDVAIDSAIELADKTGDLNVIKDGLTGIGVAAKGTASEMMDMSKVSIGLTQNMGILPGQYKDAFNILASQGDMGSFVFKEMATQAERLTAAAAQLDLKGLDDLKQYGAFLQMIRPSFGSAEEASTMLKNIMVRIKTEARKIRKETGFDVYDSAGKLKPFKSIIEGIVQGSKGDVVKLNSIFGEAAIAFTKLNQEFREGRGFDKFESFITAAGSDVLWRKFQVQTDTAKSKIQQLNNEGRKIGDWAVKPIVNDLSKLFDELSKNDTGKGIETLLKGLGGGLALIARGLVFAASGWGMIMDLYQKAVGAIAESDPVMNMLKSIYYTDAEGRSSGKAVADFNSLPAEERKRRFAQLEATGRMSIRNDQKNIINNNITIAESGRVVSETNDPNTRINTKVNRGTFPGVKKK